MVKQAIFNLVGPRHRSGRRPRPVRGLGRARHRGAVAGRARVTFVDQQPRGLAILRQNLDALGLKERAPHRPRLTSCGGSRPRPTRSKRAGIVFLDPPYDDVVLDRALKVLDREVEKATVVAEHSRRQRDAGSRAAQGGPAAPLRRHAGHGVQGLSARRSVRNRRPPSTPAASTPSPTVTSMSSIARSASSTG